MPAQPTSMCAPPLLLTVHAATHALLAAMVSSAIIPAHAVLSCAQPHARTRRTQAHPWPSSLRDGWCVRTMRTRIRHGQRRTVFSIAIHPAALLTA